MSKILQQQVYESYEYCISKTGPDLFGVGNYILGVYNDDGSLGSVIYCLDSGAYPSDSKYGKYDYIKDDQIAWYKETSELLQEYNNGKKVPAIMAFHIPLIENRTAHEKRDNKELVYEYDGSRNEAICSSEKDTTLYETALERGDVKAIVTGHDHVNDYMYNYQGIKLASSPNFSELSYTNANVQGARVFDLNASKIDDIPTYVSYIIERLNPDNFDALSKNVTVADFEKDMEFKTSGYDNNGLAGTATAVIAEGKGQNGSNALSIQRSSTGNFEVTFNFESQCKLGDNEYLVVWADFTNVEFRKACFGVVSSEGEKASYRVDDNDAKNPPLYYLADGSTEWKTLNHGWDGCFGNEQSCPIKGKKGLFAVKTSDIFQGTKAMNEKTLVFGFYFYGDVLSSSVNTEFYLDNIMFVEDYKSIGNN